MIKPFSKIFHLGSPELQDIFTGEIEVTEKLDGSQIAWGNSTLGDLFIRSKGAPIMSANVYVREPDKLFKGACEAILAVRDYLPNGTFYYGEAIANNKHNTLTYSSTPPGNIALYGILTGSGYLSDYESLKAESDRLGFGTVKLLYKGVFQSKEWLDGLLNQESDLGGTKIEGIVVKNYAQKSHHHNEDGPCFGKYVCKEFQERNGANWKEMKSKNNIDTFIDSFRNENKWVKAIQFLRDSGTLKQDPRDIGDLIKHVINDMTEEDTQFIKQCLFDMYIKRIKAASIRGLPEYYKQHLLDQSIAQIKDHVESKVESALIGA